VPGGDVKNCRDDREIIPIFIWCLINIYLMKVFKVLIFMFCWFIPFSLFAQTQTAKDIELDLYRSFRKIDNWRDRQDTLAERDSLQNANDDFAQRLKKYTAEYPFTIGEKFATLVYDHLVVATSPDGVFRIYSWDTSLGGSKHAYENVYQYKVDDKTRSAIKQVDSTEEDHPTYSFSNLYTFKVNDKAYYLGVYNGVYSARVVGQGMQVFTIENGKLFDNVKLIKNSKGLQNQLYYDYNPASVAHLKVKPSIYFDEALNTIFVPLVNLDGKVTEKYITYKFNGQYFERVKN
jgi:hypothetical protein